MRFAGRRHRYDLSVSNVWLGDDQRVRLLDLEIAHHVEDPSPVYQADRKSVSADRQLGDELIGGLFDGA
jgi:hypothetical protein